MYGINTESTHHIFTIRGFFQNGNFVHVSSKSLISWVIGCLFNKKLLRRLDVRQSIHRT